jgi:hypothetical protein
VVTLSVGGLVVWTSRRLHRPFLQQSMVTPARSFSTHGQQSAAQGSWTTVSRSDIRLIQHLDYSALGLVRRWRLIGYFPILYNPYFAPTTTARSPRKPY